MLYNIFLGGYLLLEIYWRSTGVLPEIYWRSTGDLLEIYWSTTGDLLEIYRRSTGALKYGTMGNEKLTYITLISMFKH